MELEPFPIDTEFWEEGSPQWLARYEYVEARASRYLDQFRDSEEYDFTKFEAKAGEKALTLAFERFAAGSLKLLGVEMAANNLKEASRRKIATPLTPEERAEARQKAKPVPKWRKDWEEKKRREKEEAYRRLILSQPSPDRDKRILERAYFGRYETSPMPGRNCYSINEDQGFLANGKEVDKALAYCQVHWDRYEYEHPDKERPEQLQEPTPERPPRQRLTLDELEKQKRRIAEIARMEAFNKSRSRGRGRR
jgi:hypothetical protein